MEKELEAALVLVAGFFIAFYLLLVMLGAGPSKFANPFAKWVIGKILEFGEWVVTLPFQMIRHVVFGQAKGKKKKK